jgi:nicotinate-nucleotide adenylyltransferase
VTTARRTGVLGGTFDPIHEGHLAVAMAAARALALDEVRLLPSRTPPHRPVDTAASIYHRFAMVALASQRDPRLLASDLELSRPGPSYTADTLRALHAGGLDRLQIFFLIGADAFAEISIWREYPAVLDLAHFVVCSRPGIPASSMPARVPALSARMVTLRLDGDPTPPAASPTVYLLDAPTPAVSSTEVRARARAGRPLAGLLPPEVDDYIRRHGLYSASGSAGNPGRPVAGHLHE